MHFPTMCLSETEILSFRCKKQMGHIRVEAKACFTAGGTGWRPDDDPHEKCVGRKAMSQYAEDVLGKCYKDFNQQ